MSVLKLFQPFSSQWTSRGFHTSKSLSEAAVIDGLNISKQVLKEVKVEVDKWTKSGEKRPKLIAVLVGENPASKAYVSNKMKAAKFVGIESETLRFSSDISHEELMLEIEKLNNDPAIDGLIVQLPVPKQINEKELAQAVIPIKDVDGFHLQNIGKLALNSRGMIPATALGVYELLLRIKLPTIGKNAVIIGRSKNVGLPIAMLLHSDSKSEMPGLDMTTAICHRFTPRVELEKHTKIADVIVTCAGYPGLINERMIKPGACIIDVGITRIKTQEGKSRLVGDVCYDTVKQVAGHITPVPGGVGPMTVAMLMKNTLTAAQLRKLCCETC